MGLSKAKNNPNSWNWWRHHCEYGFFESLQRTFYSIVVFPIKNTYAKIWLKYNRFEMKYMPWTKLNRTRRKIKRLEFELFGDE